MEANTQTLITILGISLEIFGFILMLAASKVLGFGGGGYTGGSPRDKKTDKPIPEILGVPHPRRQRLGIQLVIVGLALQILALFA